MSVPRVQSLKDEETYTTLIKSHLGDPKRTTQHWKSSDLDLVASHYVSFLCGIARTGCSINETMLTKCLKDMYAGSQECKDMAKKLAETLSHCRNKAKPGRMSTGTKTPKPVLEIIDAIKNGSNEKPVAKSASSQSIEDEPPAPQTPVKNDESDAMTSLQMLQDAFGVEAAAPAPAKAASSKTIDLSGSPISVASDDTPVRASMPSSSSSGVAQLPLQVFKCRGGGRSTTDATQKTFGCAWAVEEYSCGRRNL